jgi:hypothetical protein
MAVMMVLIIHLKYALLELGKYFLLVSITVKFYIWLVICDCEMLWCEVFLFQHCEMLWCEVFLFQPVETSAAKNDKGSKKKKPMPRSYQEWDK